MNEVSQKQNKELAKTEDREAKTEEMHRLFATSTDFSYSSIKRFIDLSNKKEPTKEEEKKIEELKLEISMANGLKNGLWVANLSYEKYYKFLATTRSVLVKEYNCKTPIELMMVDRIVANYWRSMKLDMILHRLIETDDSRYTFNDSKTNTIRELSKGLESASRQLNTSIMLLKELKQPALNVKVKNAIIGQNQQFNVNTQDNQQQDEIIEPK